MGRRSEQDAVISAVRSDLAAMRGRLSALEAENGLLAAANAALQDENADLRARLGMAAAAAQAPKAEPGGGPKNSSNSSRPPSSDHPHDPKSQRGGKGGDSGEGAGTDGDEGGGSAGAPPEKRKKGGQPGHEGANRGLVPTEQAQHVVACVPERCAGCGHGLPQDAGGSLPAPIREQSWELPPIRWEVTEYQRHCRDCPSCGKRSWGDRPRGAPAGCLGFRAMAAVAGLTGGAQMTRRTALGLLADLFGLPISLGGLSGAERRIAEALKPAYDEAAEALAKADVANLDETPMREPGKKPYMWLATCPAASYYMIADRRDTEAYLRLGLPAGQVKGTDRYTVYVSQVPVELHAVCWSHLGREFRGWEGDARAKAIARWLSRQTELLFSHWHAFKAGECDRDGLAERMEPVQKEVLAALRWGAGSGIPKFQGMCRNLLARWGSLWTFLRVEGVEPTNNAAERAVRRAVLWRKTSLFVQSERGRRYVERVLTVGETLKKQGCSFIGFVEASLRAARSGLPPPKLFEPAPA